MGIGERNEGNAENRGGNARNEMGMRLRGINVGLPGNWRKCKTCGESGWRCKELRPKLKYSGRNDIE